MAFLFSRVPRGALYNVMLRLAVAIVYTIYIDAQYVIHGLARRSKQYSDGRNDDNWTRIFDLLSEGKEENIELIKIKSHIDAPAEFDVLGYMRGPNGSYLSSVFC